MKVVVGAHISSYKFMEHFRKGQYSQAEKYMPKPNIYRDQTELLQIIIKRPGHWIGVCCDLTAKTIKVFDHWDLEEMHTGYSAS